MKIKLSHGSLIHHDCKFGWSCGLTYRLLVTSVGGLYKVPVQGCPTGRLRLVYGLSTVTARFFNVYGEGAPTEGAYCLVMGKFIQQIREALNRSKSLNPLL